MISIPPVRLHMGPPGVGVDWGGIGLAAGLSVSIAVLLVAGSWWAICVSRRARHPVGSAGRRLIRACRLGPDDQRVLGVLARDGGQEVVALLIAPSAFDRAAAKSVLPTNEVEALRRRVFGN